MTSGHFITNLDLSLLGYIDFCQTYYAGRQFITYCDIVFLALINTVNLLVFYNVIMEELFNTVVFLIIRGPFVWIDIKKINLLQLFKGEFASLRNNIHIKVVLDTL